MLYTSIAVILPAALTTYTLISGGFEKTITYNILFNIELAACVALLITGLISLKIQMVKLEHAFFLIITILLFGFSFLETGIVNAIENFFVYASFYSWIITTNIASLMAIKDFMVSWPGWFMRLGDKENRVMFSPLVKIAVFASIAWFMYSLWANFSWSLMLAFFAAAVTLYAIYVFLPLTDDSVMVSILSFYYFGLL